MKFSDVELAVDFVSGGQRLMQQVWVSRSTREAFWHNDLGDNEGLPEGLEDLEDLALDDDWVEVPHRAADTLQLVAPRTV